MFSPELTTQLRSHIDQSRTIGICAHQDPDGDCLGSAIGLGRYLQTLGKSIRYFVPNTPAPIYSFLPEVLTFGTHIGSSRKPDLRISVDTATRERSCLREIVTNTPIIHIDHHTTDTPRGTINLVNDTCSSCAEQITWLLLDHNKNALNPEIATPLFLGISTDTGHFQRGKHLERTFALASGLIASGADITMIVNTMYRANSYEDTLLLGQLMQTIQQDGPIIRVSINASSLEKRGVEESITSKLLHAQTTIKHDGIFMIFKVFPDEESPYLKCSFRTKNDSIDCIPLAAHRGGGGHRKAAACRVFTNDREKTQTEMLAWVKTQL